MKKISVILSSLFLLAACADGNPTTNDTCGNGTIDIGEECEPPGVGACTTDCMRDTTMCGDGECDSPETATNCPDDCSVTDPCGNGVIDEGEECDGQNFDGDTCENHNLTGTISCDENCKIDLSTCTAPVECGNNVIDQVTEACDGTDLAGQTCVSMGYAGGILRCHPDCYFDATECIDISCGNGIIEGTEVCDADNLDGQTCVSRGYTGGTLKCSNTCEFDESGCDNCGNGTKEGAEECDTNDFGSKTCITEGFAGGTLSCSAACEIVTDNCSVCGNGSLEIGEECEGTNLGSGSCTSLGFTGGTLACASNCTYDTSSCFNASCGDGSVSGSEECDGNDLNSETCQTLGFAGGTLGCDNCSFDTSACTSCGNNTIDSGEQCDGTSLNGASCTSLGFDGGTLSCNTNCTLNATACFVNTCGNGTVTGAEECDGTNLNSKTCVTQGFDGGTLSCASNCTFDTSACSTCGDYEATGTEECDRYDYNGNTCESLGYAGGWLSCNTDCTLNTSSCSVCGNGIVQEGEQCDDGNTNNNDGCDSNCMVESNAYRPIRLTGGEGSNEGRVQIYRDGTWYSICDDNWDGTEQEVADVICRQLGYTGTGHRFISSYAGLTVDNFIMDDVSCTGTEEYIHQCSHEGKDDCTTSEALGVECMPGEGDVRFIDGPNGMEGRLQVYHSGSWGDVCDDVLELDSYDYGTYTVCEQMGHKYGGFLDNTYTGSGNFHLDQVSCVGTEKRLTECSHADWGVNDCSDIEAAGMRCQVWSEGNVRLMDGSERNSGRIEILHNGVWGTVCDDGLESYGTFGDDFVTVACGELGFSSAGSVNSSFIAHGTDPIWLDNVECTGTEMSIESCDANDWGVNNCEHYEDTEITCTP